MNFRKSLRTATLLLTVAVLAISSCRQKDDPTTPITTGSFKMEFTNMVGGQHMNLNTDWYVNAANDSFKISTYKYYVTNIVLHGTDGKDYTEPESYHLINEENPATTKFSMSNVPVGNYSSVTFMIGVDSLHNTTGAQAGDLAPGFGMVWTWNTGYIMAKMEGIANTSTNAGKIFQLHIAGFHGAYNVIKTVTLPFPENAVVSATKAPNAHLFSEALEWFKTPTVVGFTDYNDITVEGKKALTISNNYADMFTVDHIDN